MSNFNYFFVETREIKNDFFLRRINGLILDITSTDSKNKFLSHSSKALQISAK